MKVEKITSNSVITPKSTGYAATAILTTSILSGVSKNRTFRKQHKTLAYLSAALTVLHVGLIEYYHSKFKFGKK